MKKSLKTGTLVIIGAGLIIKSIGFATRIIISNAVGAEGLGLYQLFYPFYSLIILTISSGITLAQSGLISEASTKSNWGDVKRINSVALYTSTAVSIVVGVLIYFTAWEIANNIFKDDRLTLSIKLFAPFIPFITLASVLRGYFYGLGNITPTAISGIVEQIAKIGVVLTLATWASNYGLEYACFVLAVGLVAGELANLVVMAIAYLKRPRVPGLNVDKLKSTRNIDLNVDKFKSHRDFGSNVATLSVKETFTKIVNISMPVSANRFVVSVLVALEMIFIKSALTRTGMDYNFSLEEFGRLTGMVMPLIFFPMILTNAIATTLIPAISEALAQDNSEKCTNRITKAIIFSIASGVVFTGVFLSYSDQIAWTIYRSMRCGEMLFLMAFSCTFIYLQQTLTGILNGLGRQGVLFANTIIGFIIRLGSIYMLIPVYGINGYVYGLIVSSVLVAFFNLSYLVKYMKLCIEFGKCIVRPIMACGVLMLFSGLIFDFFKLCIGSAKGATFASVAVLSCLGYVLMFIFRILEYKEFVFMIPFRKKS